MKLEMTGSIFSPKCTQALLNLQRKNKNCVFSESKLVPPVLQILGSAPEMGRLVLVHYMISSTI